MLVAILKEYVVLNGLCEILKVARSENYSYKYKSDQTLFFRIPLREEALDLLAYSYSFRKSGNLSHEIASLMQEVKYSKVHPLSLEIFIGISPAVALFGGSFTMCTLTS